jgi:hypothetical protein
MDDWQSADGTADVYDLPEGVVLAQAALFFGCRVQRTDNLQAREYVQYILSWMEMKAQTGCIALLSLKSGESLLIYMYQGKFIGAFLPDEQHYFDDFLVVDVFTRNEPASEVHVLILPPELIRDTVRIGYALNKLIN